MSKATGASQASVYRTLRHAHAPGQWPRASVIQSAPQVIVRKTTLATVHAPRLLIDCAAPVSPPSTPNGIRPARREQGGMNAPVRKVRSEGT